MCDGVFVFGRFWVRPFGVVFVPQAAGGKTGFVHAVHNHVLVPENGYTHIAVSGFPFKPLRFCFRRGADKIGISLHGCKHGMGVGTEFHGAAADYSAVFCRKTENAAGAGRARVYNGKNSRHNNCADMFKSHRILLPP